MTLPSAFAIDQRHLGNICSEKELAEKQCAGRTPIGKATTTTPLLDQPLAGPVYAVSGSGGLPRLAFILNGQVNLVPRAETKTITKGGAGQLQTTVPVVPDAPIGHFHLTVFGGKTGYLVNTRDLCAHAPGHQGRLHRPRTARRDSEAVKVKAACGKKSKRAKRHSADPPASASPPRGTQAFANRPWAWENRGGDDSGKPEVRVRAGHRGDDRGAGRLRRARRRRPRGRRQARPALADDRRHRLGQGGRAGRGAFRRRHASSPSCSPARRRRSNARGRRWSAPCATARRRR